jgi:dienelactone hydrolase
MHPMRQRLSDIALAVITTVMAHSHAQGAAPPPKIVSACYPARPQNAIIDKMTIRTKVGRVVPFEILMPDHPGRYPLVLFSHGALASPDRYYALLKPVAAAGYIIVAPRHLDSELWEWEKPPAQADVWTTRIEDVDLGLSYPQAIRARVLRHGASVETGKTAAIGHSFGALIAQLSGGAKALAPTPHQTSASVKAVIALSPPGALPGLMDRGGWQTIAVPNLTITGTADVLPGFIDNWKVHKQSFEHTTAARKWLWVGDGIDHYFGGMIGREKPAPETSRLLFQRAVATTISFLDRAFDKKPSCILGASIAGEVLTRSE